VPNRGAARLLVLLLAATVLSLAPPASAGEWVPRPVLNVDFPDPAVVAAPGGLVAYATGDLVPHAWSRQPDGPWRRGPGRDGTSFRRSTVNPSSPVAFSRRARAISSR